MNVLAELNPAQKQAVETIDGPLLILAGPGSGKTRVITHRIAYLITVCGISPYHIMTVTFTNKAAKEMKERLEKLLGQAVEALTMGTFHAICARFLRQEGKAIGLDPRFVIYDEEDQLSLIKQSLIELDLDPKQYSPKAVQSAIKFAKSQLLTPGDYGRQARSYFEEVAYRVYEHYQQLLSRSQAVDFDDLLMKVVQLFNDHPKVLSKYQSRYVHILVDEFQDTNTTQYMLIKQLGGKHRNICVVGDPDQSIYSWRFADSGNILSFEKDYPDAKVTLLDQNYRSTQTILEVASNIISPNLRRKPRDLWTENEVGIPVTIVKTYSEGEEAQFVISEIEKLSSNGAISPGDCAIMYRVNAQSRVLEEAFMRYGIPYKLVSGTRFYQRREIKDIIAYLRIIHNPCDNVSLVRIINIPGRGIGQRTIAELSNWANAQNIPLYSAVKMTAEKKGPPITLRASQALTNFFTLIDQLITSSQELDLSSLLYEVTERSGYKDYLLNDEDGEDRWENIMELRTVAKEYDELDPPEALANFLEKVSLVSEIDDLDAKTTATTLITLHQAKGLEFPVAFIVGMEEGLLPHRRSFADPEELEEERRLCYVGVTRAQKQVYLVYTYSRSLFGSRSLVQPSRFLKDIPPSLVATKGMWEGEEQKKEGEVTPVTTCFTRPIPQRLNALDLNIGDHVNHSIFGEGVVVSCAPVSDDHEVIIAFTGAGVKKLLLSLAPLEKTTENSDIHTQDIDGMREDP